jgi:hypothetical protein
MGLLFYISVYAQDGYHSELPLEFRELCFLSIERRTSGSLLSVRGDRLWPHVLRESQFSREPMNTCTYYTYRETITDFLWRAGSGILSACSSLSY